MTIARCLLSEAPFLILMGTKQASSKACSLSNAMLRNTRRSRRLLRALELLHRLILTYAQMSFVNLLNTIF